jgi:hypothetical protein
VGAAPVGVLWTDGLVCAWAAVGVSPAAAKAIAHPINLIFTPVSAYLGEVRDRASLEVERSIGAASESLKHLVRHEMGRC